MTSFPPKNRAAGRAAPQVTAARCAAKSRLTSRIRPAGTLSRALVLSVDEAHRLAQESLQVALSADAQTIGIFRKMKAVTEELNSGGDSRYAAEAKAQARRASFTVVRGEVA